MAPQFQNKTVLVTGGGTGIGRASALALAGEGCSVTVCGRTTSALDETVALIQSAGGTARSIRCDVSDEASVRHAVTEAIGETGRLDFGINSAGVSGGGDLQPAADYPTDRFDLMFATDLRGTFLSMKYELKQMKTQGFGSIVNIASITGLVGYPGVSGYVAAKHGQVGLTKAAALDYAPDGIRINAIAAGLVDTPLIADRPPDVLAARTALHPLGRVAQASEIADAVVWLCSDKSSFVTGAAIPVDGGWTAQ